MMYCTYVCRVDLTSVGDQHSPFPTNPTGFSTLTRTIPLPVPIPPKRVEWVAKHRHHQWISAASPMNVLPQQLTQTVHRFPAQAMENTRYNYMHMMVQYKHAEIIQTPHPSSIPPILIQPTVPPNQIRVAFRSQRLKCESPPVNNLYTTRRNSVA